MSKPLTLEDIRNPKRKSGFDHVGSAMSGGHHANPTRWTADANRGGKKNQRAFRGPARHTPEEAAQDYCNYVNGIAVAVPAILTAVDKTSRPTSERRVVSEREKRLRKELRKELRQNPPKRLHEPICYLVGMRDDLNAVKIGYADYNVYSRIDSLQTGNPYELILLGTIPGGIKTEKRLHTKYFKENILQEWFRPTSQLLAEFGLSWLDFLRKATH